MKKKMILAALLLTLQLSQTAMADYDREVIQEVQHALNEAGFDCGTPDGIAGSKTAAAISAFQEQTGIEVTGEISEELLNALNIQEPDMDVSAEAVQAVEPSAETVQVPEQSEGIAEAPEENEDSSKSLEEILSELPEDTQARIAELISVTPAETMDILLEPVPNDAGKPTSTCSEQYDENGDVRFKYTSYEEYDENGYIIRRSSVQEQNWYGDEWSSSIEGTLYTRDEEGNAVLDADYHYGKWEGDEEETARLTMYWIRDERDNTSSTVSLGFGSTGTNYEYDAQGNRTAIPYREYDTAQINGYDITIYDENGFPVRIEKMSRSMDEQKYDPFSDDIPYITDFSTTLIETDEAGRPVKETLTESTLPDDPVGKYTTYEYDGDGRVLAERSFRQDGTPEMETVYTYLEEGYTRRRQLFEEDGTPGDYYLYTYDSDGNQRTSEGYTADDKPLSRSVRDEYGIPTEDSRWNEAGELTQELVNEYDDEGRVITSITYGDGNKEKVLSRRIYTY